MSKSPSKESDIPPLSHIGSSVERHSSDAHQNSPGSIPTRAEIFFGSIARVFITRNYY